MNIVFHPKNEESPFEITIYIGTPDNLNFGGEANEDEIANQIAECVGPSGTNVEYICNLAKAMREIVPDVIDEHLFTIEAKVLKLISREL